ncbi:NTP pyrophosphohydrolase [Thiorhodovibrio frisius]|uniref:RNA pyrophosphohydrolase n=1 Tax=Thiorhodovibrio frisius TaxID=631362 RepID=H8Z149_9GAMM|nr:NTP pyrophosphohydrolase [Thiorhodovibrio frisius]WPL24771.1 RNA pyrophosphohydrolase [Thiorhodovibrio frisius]
MVPLQSEQNLGRQSASIADLGADLPLSHELWKNASEILKRWPGLIDRDGFRPNVGIILCNGERRLFWGRRVGQNAWQFPQGGIQANETPQEAMFRELEEEVGLVARQVTLLGATRGWLRYRLPKRFIRRHCCGPTCIGQKQIWFLLRVDCNEDAFCLDHSSKPEFDAWRWVRYWSPLREVVYFKRRVYEQALIELQPLLYPELRGDRQSRSPNGLTRHSQKASQPDLHPNLHPNLHSGPQSAQPLPVDWAAVEPTGPEQPPAACRRR